MLQITPQQTIFVAIKPVDFRKGIDGLAALCRSQLNHDPFSGALFVFTNRQRTAVKIIVYDGQGFWLCMKRFSQGKLAWWPTANTPTNTPDPQSKKSSHLKIGEKSSGQRRRPWNIRRMLRFLMQPFHRFLIIPGKPILG